MSSFLPTLKVTGSGVEVGIVVGLGLAVWLELGAKVGVTLGTRVAVWLGSGGKISGISSLGPQELKKSAAIRIESFK